MKQIKRKITKISAICMMFIIGLTFSVQPSFAGGNKWEPMHHIGKYYFKYNNYKERLYISTKKNSGFKKTPVNCSQFASNGKQVMYPEQDGRRYYMKSYDIASGKIKKVLKFPKSDYWQIVLVKNGCFWLSNDKNIYRYKVKTNKLKMVKKGAYLSPLKGSYYETQSIKAKNYKSIGAVFEDGTIYHDIKTYQVGIYKILKSGKFKRIKSLGTVYGYAEVEDKNRDVKAIYYAKANAHELYRVNYNGKKAKLIASFDGYITDVFDDRCYLVEKGIAYEYIYDTGYVIELTEEEYLF